MASFKSALVPKWVGWSGLLSALLVGFVGLFESLFKAADLIGTIGLIPFAVWMIGMGMGILRSKEPATP